jgi:dTDP-4-dehydrorhamnose 3,5-epimerase
MEIEKTVIEGVFLLRPRIFHDTRGYFLETFRTDRYREVIPHEFVQDNMSYSQHGTLRGLHYQIIQPQAKLVQVVRGKIFDVVVDIRKSSPTFGKHLSVYLSDEAMEQLYVPVGFAHGFCVLSDEACVTYKCSDFYCPQGERGVLWSDPDLNIEWPIQAPVLSPKDCLYPTLKNIPDKDLPR